MGVFHTCKNLTGQLFGLLTVVSRAENANDGHARWYCLCKCGNTTIVQSNNLKTKSVGSCGCQIKVRVAKLNLTHGKYKTKEYKAWDSMKQRCYNPNNSSYMHYGCRGIKVCERWLKSFENFYTDMGNAPNRTFSIDRIDVNGNYEASNCRWATPKEQRANQRIKS